VPEAPRGRIYASTRAHRTVHRSAAVLGLGRECVVAVEADRQGRIRPDALAAALDLDIGAGLLPLAVVAVAGTTDMGTVDPIRDVVDVARARGCWVHIDGAYGLVANASPELAPRFDGSADADSWIIDPHKWLTTGVGVGAAYVRDGALLTRAFAEGHADYLEGSFASIEDVHSEFDGMAGPWADQGVELSAPPRGALVWAVLREIGRRGVAARVERHVALARSLADRVIDHPRLELLCEPELSVVCYRYVPPPGVDADQLNAQLLTQLRRTTTTVPSSTIADGHFALRPCFINPRVTVAEVDALLDNTISIGDRLASAMDGRSDAERG
jgi:aromatic-L-amino-acid decarboxylase